MPVDVMQVNHIRPEPIQLPQDPSRSGAGLKPVFTADAGLRGLHPNIAEARAGYPRLMTIGPAAQNMVFNRTICEQLTNADTDLAGTANSAGCIDLNNPHFFSSVLPKWDVGVCVKGADTGAATYERRIQVVHHEKPDDNTFGYFGDVFDIVFCMLQHFRHSDRNENNEIVVHAHSQSVHGSKALQKE